MTIRKDFELTPDLIKSFDIRAPRYTSYPTAADWQDIDPNALTQEWEVWRSQPEPISLYCHIPFCQSQCWYCGCQVSVRKKRPQTTEPFLRSLRIEAQKVKAYFGHSIKVNELHLGGGTPNFLTNSELDELYEILMESFDLSGLQESAIECDPRTLNLEQIEWFLQHQFNRWSLGIQDFNSHVQEKINRIQSYDRIEELVSILRKEKVSSINFDLIYGLPDQKPETFKETTNQVLELNPDRIALYSFAHMPTLKSHQKRIAPEDLPGRDEKLQIFCEASKQLIQSDYIQIGMDHFARKTDSMAQAYLAGDLNRNFMGYTTQESKRGLGLGPSAIGYSPNVFFQNEKKLEIYQELLQQGRLPVKRGKCLSLDDQKRKWIIENLMCQFSISIHKYEELFGRDLIEDLNVRDHIDYCYQKQLLKQEGDVIKATALGELFVRNICVGFDAYREGETRKFFQKQFNLDYARPLRFFIKSIKTNPPS